MKRTFIFFIIILSFFSFKKNQKEILSPSTTIIVIPDKANSQENQGASTISKWLKKIYKTDSGFTIIKQSLLKDTKGKIIIAIGNTKFISLKSLENFPPYSFLINKNENVVTIAGIDYMGTLIGTGYFLDRFCGVRFYIPGDLFTSTPKTNKVELDKTINVKEAPSTKYVYSTGYKSVDMNWAYINGLIRKNWGCHQHSMGDQIFSRFNYKKIP